jgi:hypothetical protein
VRYSTSACLLILCVGCTAFPEQPASSGDPGDVGANNTAEVGGDTGFDDADTSDPQDTTGPDADPQCVTDRDCLDSRFCNGLEFCAQGVCQAGVAPDPDDDDPCTHDSCTECADDDLECELGTQGHLVHQPTGECTCTLDDDCDKVACATTTCVEGQCTSDPVDGGRCAAACREGELDGTCENGSCVLPLEGPHQSALCRNGRDDDCDGQVDNNPDCALADALTLDPQAESGSVGTGPDHGVTLVVTPRASGESMRAQADNLYCTARNILYEQRFDSDDSVANDPLAEVVNGPGAAVGGRPGSRGGSGLAICAGASIRIGPLTFPSSEHGLRVSIRVGQTADERELAEADDRVIVSYRDDATVDIDSVPTWVASGVWGRAPLDFGDVQHDIIIDRNSDSSQAWIRIDHWTTNVDAPTRSCFWVDDLVISAVRRPNPLGARHRPTWAAFGGSESRESFDGRSPEDIIPWLAAGQGQHSIGIEDFLALGGTHGLTWRFDGASWSSLFLPRITAPPRVFDRRMPMVAEVGLEFIGPANPSPPALGIGLTAPGVETTRYAGMPHPYDVAWISGALELRPERRRAVFHRVVLPEPAKNMLELDVFVSSDDPIDPLTYLVIDEVDLFFHGDVIEDAAVTAQVSDGPRYPFQLRGVRAGTYRVQCFWQTPLTPNLATIASSPVDVRLR